MFFFFQAEDGIRDRDVTGVQTCALPISRKRVRDSERDVISLDPTLHEDLDRGLGVITSRSESLTRFLASYTQLARLPAPTKEIGRASCRGSVYVRGAAVAWRRTGRCRIV